MSRNARNAARQPRPAQPASPDQPRQRPSAEAPGASATPSFPFARTAEDDELRDMSGYGWGV